MTDLSKNQPTILRGLTFDLLTLVLPILGLAPLLLLHTMQLLEKPYSRFLPVAWICLVIFAMTSPKAVVTSGLRSFLGSGFLMLALLCGIFAVAYFSPWTANLALGFVFIGWAIIRLEVKTSRVIALSMLSFVTLPLPFGLADRLTTSVDEKAMMLCSPVLDLFNIYHLYVSPSLLLKNYRFDIRELLATPLSLQPMVAIAILFSVAWRRPFFTTVFSIFSAVVWAFVGKLFYLFTAAALSNVEIDVTHGFLGTIVFGTILTFTILLIICSDTFWNASFRPIRIGDGNVERSIAGNLFNSCVVWPGELTSEDSVELPVAYQATGSLSGLAFWLAIPIGFIMFFLMVPTSVAIYRNDLILNRASYLDVAADRLPDASTLAEDFFLKQRQRQFISNANSAISGNQAKSLIWNFSGSGTQTSVLLKFPVRGWLDSRFFLGPEWVNPKTQMQNDDTNWAWSETTAQKEGGLSTLVLSTQMNTNGSPYTPNADELNISSNAVAVTSRWMDWRIFDLMNAKQETLKPQTFCVQLRYQSESSIKDSEKKMLVQKFLQSRKILTDRLLGKSEPTAP